MCAAQAFLSLLVFPLPLLWFSLIFSHHTVLSSLIPCRPQVVLTCRYFERIVHLLCVHVKMSLHFCVLILYNKRGANHSFNIFIKAQLRSKPYKQKCLHSLKYYHWSIAYLGLLSQIFYPRKLTKSSVLFVLVYSWMNFKFHYGKQTSLNIKTSSDIYKKNQKIVTDYVIEIPSTVPRSAPIHFAPHLLYKCHLALWHIWKHNKELILELWISNNFVLVNSLQTFVHKT